MWYYRAVYMCWMAEYLEMHCHCCHVENSHTAASPLHSRDIYIGIYGLQFTAEVINKIMHSHRCINISSIAPSRPFEFMASLLSHKTRRELCCGPWRNCQSAVLHAMPRRSISSSSRVNFEDEINPKGGRLTLSLERVLCTLFFSHSIRSH